MNERTQEGSALNKPDILAVMLNERVELRHRGRVMVGLCPLHTEKTPSFQVNIDRQRWHCFGCNDGGDVISFVMKRHGLTFRDALTYIGIKPGKPPKVDLQISRRRELQRRFDARISTLYQNLCDEAIALHRSRIEVRKNPGSLTEAKAFLFAESMARLDQVDYQIDTLWNGSVEDKISLLKENHNANRAAT